MKKNVGRSLAFVLMITVFAVASAFTVLAQGELTLSISDKKVKQGTDTVTLDVTVKNNTGIAGITMNIEFDNTAFEVKSVKDGDFSSFTVVQGQGTQSPYKILLFNLGGANVTGDGKLLSVTFDILDNADSGTYNVTVNSESDKLLVIDENGAELDCATVSGSITLQTQKAGSAADGSVSDGKNGKDGNDDETGSDDELYEEKWINPFTDVKEDDWFYSFVEYVAKKGLFKGITETTFGPSQVLTRAMLVTVLYRAEGEPEITQEAGFEDVDVDAYYAKAVAWAKANSIVDGMTDTEFAPNVNITREQIAAIMFRYAIYKGMNAVTMEENLHFDDAEAISEYAVLALNWAVGSGLMNGRTETTINAKDNATRAEVATIITRYFTEIAQ